MQDLDVTLRTELDRQFREARAKLTIPDVSAAVTLAQSAWNRLPEPKFGWDVSKSYTHALAGIFRDCGEFSKAIEIMNQLLESGTVKPYQDQPRFVLGTIYYEMGDLRQARAWLKEANQISKGRCFEGQPDKYRTAIQ